MQDDLTLPKPKDLAPSDRLVELYIAGECTLAEQAAMERWINANPSHGRVLRALRDNGAVAANEAHTIADVGAAERRVLDRIGRTGSASLEKGREALLGLVQWRQTSRADVPGFGTRMLRWGMWSAAVGGVVVAIWGSLAVRPRADRPASVVAYTTKNGQQAMVTLTDGSTVALGPASRLEISAEYSARTRVVRLRGEALFTVARRDGLPFTVVTGTSTTRVLGTTFLVRHYAMDPAVTVAVREGKVAVSSGAAQPTVITAERQAVISNDGRVVLSHADPAQFTFARGVLTLNSVSLQRAIIELNRWYDVDLRLGDQVLEQRHLKGEFAAGSLGDLVNLLELTFDVRVVRQGRILTLFPR